LRNAEVVVWPFTTINSYCVGSENHRYYKSLKIRYLFSTNQIYLKIVRQRTEIMHQQRVSNIGSRITQCAVGEWRQRPPLEFVLEEDILSTCNNKNNVM